MASRRAARRAPIGLLELAQRVRAWRLAGVKGGYDQAIALLREIEYAIRAAVGPVPGICSHCGCSEFDACVGGCAWATPSQTVCTTPACLEAAGISRPAASPAPRQAKQPSFGEFGILKVLRGDRGQATATKARPSAKRQPRKRTA